jgi:FkbM family methyltransferase
MALIKDIVRPLVPASMRRKVREMKTKRDIQMWRALDLYWDLAGLRVRVSSKSDWTVFNEIFVDGSYDRAIAQVLGNAPTNQLLNVLDLGANVGFFAMRFAQIVFQSDYPDRPFFIHCVEGSPGVYAELCVRVASNPRLKGHIETLNGLVGVRSGSTKIYESRFGSGNSTVPQHWSTPVDVSYIDLETVLPDDEPIALLKCDIEGSEQTFQDQYHNLLQRVQTAVVELHHNYINPDKFYEGMAALNFAHHEVLWKNEMEREPDPLVLFTR